MLTTTKKLTIKKLTRNTIATQLFPQSPLANGSLLLLVGSQNGGWSFDNAFNKVLLNLKINSFLKCKQFESKFYLFYYHPALVQSGKSVIMLRKIFSKLNNSFKPASNLTNIKRFMPNIPKIKITKKSKIPMFNNAGIEMARANRRVRRPRVPFISRSTRPTLKILTTLRIVGEKLII